MSNPNRPIHLYLGDYAPHVQPLCKGRHLVAIRHTTTSPQQVTCALCSGLLHAGLMTERAVLEAKVERCRQEVVTRESMLMSARGRLERAEAALNQFTATPQGDGDPRPLEAGDGSE